MKKLLLFSLTGFMFIITSCVSPGKIRTTNKNNMLQIEPGMSKSDVISIMGGVETKPDEFGKLQVNPYHYEMFEVNPDDTVEVLWYYTDQVYADGIVNQAELTPIVLDNNKVVAIGWKFYQDFFKRKKLSAEKRDAEPVGEQATTDNSEVK